MSAAKVAMINNSSYRNVVISLLEQCANKVVSGKAQATDYNVILSASLFHPIEEKMNEKEIGEKYKKVIRENLFNKVMIIAIQKSTYKAVYDFLTSEVGNSDEE